MQIGNFGLLYLYNLRLIPSRELGANTLCHQFLIESLDVKRRPLHSWPKVVFFFVFDLMNVDAPIGVNQAVVKSAATLQ